MFLIQIQRRNCGEVGTLSYFGDSLLGAPFASAVEASRDAETFADHLARRELDQNVLESRSSPGKHAADYIHSGSDHFGKPLTITASIVQIS